MSQTKFITLSVITLALLLMAYQNRAPVSTHILFFRVVMPQIVLLLIAAGLGFVMGLTVAAQSKSKGKSSGGSRGR
jgi:uncharacterized integral membrane protein